MTANRAELDQHWSQILSRAAAVLDEPATSTPDADRLRAAIDFAAAVDALMGAAPAGHRRLAVHASASTLITYRDSPERRDELVAAWEVLDALLADVPRS